MGGEESIKKKCFPGIEWNINVCERSMFANLTPNKYGVR